MEFKLTHNDVKSGARAGKLHTGHGIIQTPIFMPVGTTGSVKGVSQQNLAGHINAQIILGNTYHLYLRPGPGILQQAGGLHKFIGWERPMLTDSGGYQVYSISDKRKINEEGVWFKSHIDGSKHLFTPENVMDIQRQIGADIIMAFDECTPYPCEYNYARNSMHLTHRWLQRCCERFDSTEPLYDYSQALFPIVQGSVYPDLRKQSAEFVAGMTREGNAIGGLSVGEPAEDMYAMTELVCGILPADKPRYLMGVGKPANILECIALGIDMFDCVMPTRNGRHGLLFTSKGTINLRNRKWENDFSPVDDVITPQCSKAYLRHLIICKEILGAHIATMQNLRFYLWLVETAREKIIEGTFAGWKNEMVLKLSERL